MTQTIEERDREMVAMYENGKTLREIGEHYGMTHQGVHLRLKQAGVKLRRKGNRVQPVQGEPWWIEMYNQGHSAAKIGKEANVPTSTVIRYLRAHDVQMRPQYNHKTSAHFEALQTGRKTCSKCGEEKSLHDDFFPLSAGSHIGDGHMAHCKKCHMAMSSYSRKKRWQNPETQPIVRQQTREYTSRWRNKNKEYIRAKARERYANDPAVRQQALEANRAYLQRKKAKETQE